ncbi:MAG TPA: YbhB/YbcL family Raf kinase inhibitor-like protein, partial [Spirochaetota bacterium]|nr:YbhB/YbcL family Raf kinase inhibitor-like protein [Spirochaetota bacterium]
MILNSVAFNEGSSIPVKYTGDGTDLSPPLEWSDIPSGTKSFAIICDDPDAPSGAWVHWVIYNILPSMSSLYEGI